MKSSTKQKNGTLSSNCATVEEIMKSEITFKRFLFHLEEIVAKYEVEILRAGEHRTPAYLFHAFDTFLNTDVNFWCLCDSNNY